MTVQDGVVSRLIRNLKEGFSGDVAHTKSWANAGHWINKTVLSTLGKFMFHCTLYMDYEVQIEM